MDNLRSASSADTDEQSNTTKTFTAWERRTRVWALVLAALTFIVSALVVLVATRTWQLAETTLVLALVPDRKSVV